MYQIITERFKNQKIKKGFFFTESSYSSSVTIHVLIGKLYTIRVEKTIIKCLEGWEESLHATTQM